MTGAETLTASPVVHKFEFRGDGREYFRIWIVNLALTVITLGIYSAWAKVRTRRYFYGNTIIADHALDYHASPVRILIGRFIAVSLLVGYNVSLSVTPYALIFWAPFFFFVFPWLINSSLRFNARNTSYRNVRFNFTGRYGGAMAAYILWPILGMVTFFTLSPLARRVRDYFYINHHTYGGRPFRTQFSGGRVYAIYLFGIVLFIALVGGGAAAVAFGGHALGQQLPDILKNSAAMSMLPFVFIIIFEFLFIFIAVVVSTMVFNLSIGHTRLDERHGFKSRLSALRLTWITLTNLVLTLLTLGIYYPWARVRITRYMIGRLSLLATSDLDEFTSEVFGTQSAVGEEIAGFFDIDFGL